jgi:hypothetical protein
MLAELYHSPLSITSINGTASISKPDKYFNSISPTPLSIPLKKHHSL